MTSQNHERRRAPRVAADFPIQFRGADGNREGRVRDISEIGLSCAFPEALDEMTVVKIGLALPGNDGPLELEGAVVRCEPLRENGYEVAVYFTHHPNDSRNALRAWVEEHAENVI